MLQRMYPNNQRRYENRVAPPLVEAQAQRVRQAGCITLSRDLAGMEATEGGPVTDSGPAIAPISLHAGVVTNMEDDARARAFFEGARGGGPERRQRAARAADLSRAVRHPGRARPGAGPGASRRVRRALSGEVLMRQVILALAAMGAGTVAAAAAGAGPGGLRAGCSGPTTRRSGSIRTTSGATIGRCCGRMCARAAQAADQGRLPDELGGPRRDAGAGAAAGSVHHHGQRAGDSADDRRARHRHRESGTRRGLTAFFRGLGYRSRGIGAQTLGRRLFIGPFTSQGALDQALEVARKAGFIAPHVAAHTRF